MSGLDDVTLLVLIQELCNSAEHILRDHEARGPCFVGLANAIQRVQRMCGLPVTLNPGDFER